MKKKKDNKEELIIPREDLIVNRLRDNWSYYRKLSLEDIRKDIRSYLREKMNNPNEQLSHEEFTELLLKEMKKKKEEISGKKKNSKLRNKRNDIGER